MNGWRVATILGACYGLGGVATLYFAISTGRKTGILFDGFTGNETPEIKAVECVMAWPVVILKIIKMKRSE